MLEPQAVSTPRIEATYKSPEVEGALDLFFYRRLGFPLAQFFAARAVTPSQVTLLGTLIGIAAGHLYFYEALWLNVCGMLLHIGANLLDNVDGQLARLTRTQSESGKVIDGIGDNLVFASVYVHLCLRYMNDGGSELVWVLAIAAGVCHSFQSAAAEFCRDVYAFFANGRAGQMFTASALSHRAAQSSFPRNILLVLHASYVRQQEIALPRLARLRDLFAGTNPEWLKAAYRQQDAGLVRRSRLLGTNTRMFVLFFALFIRQPVFYFIAEVTLFNALFGWLILRQNSAASHLLQLAKTRAAG